jgi:hypothetical protein
MVHVPKVNVSGPNTGLPVELELDDKDELDELPVLDDELVLDEDEELRAEVSPLVDDELPELPDDAPQHAAK